MDLSVPASGYASLTGPGQTETPGSLTQEGDLTVVGNYTGVGDFFTNSDSSTGNQIWSYGDASQNLLKSISTDAKTDSQIQTTPTTISIAAGLGAAPDASAVLNLGGGIGGGSASVRIATPGGTSPSSWEAGEGTIGFLGAAATSPQVSGGTLAGVIAGLVALGLFSS